VSYSRNYVSYRHIVFFNIISGFETQNVSANRGQLGDEEDSGVQNHRDIRRSVRSKNEVRFTYY
jgi:hypothetical protein